MMQKDEGKLLDLWLTYYFHLIGSKDLYIFDNNSTDPLTLKILKQAQVNGSHVKYNTNFTNKGNVICGTIKMLAKKGVYDFFFPLDCDELVAVPTMKGLKFDTDSIHSALLPFINTKNALIIRKYLHNNPFKPNYYNRTFTRKIFFPRTGCSTLDLGFHGALITDEQRIETNLYYIHFHYRPYKQYIERSKQKMKRRIVNFEKDTLENYKGSGIHLIKHLLQSEEEYNKSFEAFTIHIPQIAEHIKKISKSKIRLSDLWI